MKLKSIFSRVFVLFLIINSLLATDQIIEDVQQQISRIVEYDNIDKDLMSIFTEEFLRDAMAEVVPLVEEISRRKFPEIPKLITQNSNEAFLKNLIGKIYEHQYVNMRYGIGIPVDVEKEKQNLEAAISKYSMDYVTLANEALDESLAHIYFTNEIFINPYVYVKLQKQTADYMNITCDKEYLMSAFKAQLAQILSLALQINTEDIMDQRFTLEEESIKVSTLIQSGFASYVEYNVRKKLGLPKVNYKENYEKNYPKGINIAEAVIEKQIPVNKRLVQNFQFVEHIINEYGTDELWKIIASPFKDFTSFDTVLTNFYTIQRIKSGNELPEQIAKKIENNFSKTNIVTFSKELFWENHSSFLNVFPVNYFDIDFKYITNLRAIVGGMSDQVFNITFYEIGNEQDASNFMDIDMLGFQRFYQGAMRADIERNIVDFEGIELPIIKTTYPNYPTPSFDLWLNKGTMIVRIFLRDGTIEDLKKFVINQTGLLKLPNDKHSSKIKIVKEIKINEFDGPTKKKGTFKKLIKKCANLFQKK